MVIRFLGNWATTLSPLSTKPLETMNAYRKEQLDCHLMVRDALRAMTAADVQRLKDRFRSYGVFRERVDRFLTRHISGICTASCFQNHLSACCSKDGVMTFFADHVANAVLAEPEALTALIDTLASPAATSMKCIYLGSEGCLWQIKPIICQMFLCEPATAAIAHCGHDVLKEWGALEADAKGFRWPDRPVLFDAVEAHFIGLGVDSPLMHLHKSPGLLRLKRCHGVSLPSGTIDPPVI